VEVAVVAAEAAVAVVASEDTGLAAAAVVVEWAAADDTLEEMEVDHTDLEEFAVVASWEGTVSMARSVAERLDIFVAGHNLVAVVEAHCNCPLERC